MDIGKSASPQAIVVVLEVSEGERSAVIKTQYERERDVFCWLLSDDETSEGVSI